MTAIVAAGLAARAQARSGTPLPRATGVQRRPALAAAGRRRAARVAIERRRAARTVRVRHHGRRRAARASCACTLRITDRTRLARRNARPRAAHASRSNVALPLGRRRRSGEAHALTLHDARVFGQSWERWCSATRRHRQRPRRGEPVLPEARVLLRPRCSASRADLQGAASLALSNLMLGARHHRRRTAAWSATRSTSSCTTRPGSCASALAAAGAQVQARARVAARAALAGGIDIAARTRARARRRCRRHRGGGRFGWQADVSASLAGPTPAERHAAVGPTGALPTVGGLQLRATLAAGQAPALALHWHRPGGAPTSAALWPQPDGAALARMLAQGRAEPRRPRRARDDARRRRRRRAR